MKIMNYLKTFESFNLVDLEKGKVYSYENEQQTMNLEYLGLKKENPSLKGKVSIEIGKRPKFLFEWITEEGFRKDIFVALSKESIKTNLTNP